MPSDKTEITSGSASHSIAPYALHWRSRLWAMAGLLVLLMVVAASATSLGSHHIPFADVWKILLSELPLVDMEQTWSEADEVIVLSIRLPRIVLAALVGASLSVAGATYQGLFRNPLADPYLLGVAQGALLGAVIGFSLPGYQADTAGLGIVPSLAFMGAIVAVGIVYSVARTGKTLPVTTLILAGVALGAFLMAISQYLMYQSDNEELHAIIGWMFGHIDDEWIKVVSVLPFAVVGTVIIWFFARPLNIMQLDEEQAQQLGVNVERVKLILLGCSTLITAAAVVFCGLIGFVGIIIPHAVRLLWGPDHRFLLPLCTLVGAIFLIMTDTLVRTVNISGEKEIPIGVITASVGAPFFIYLLRIRKRGTFF